jgi:hypothetical protein
VAHYSASLGQISAALGAESSRQALRKGQSHQEEPSVSAAYALFYLRRKSPTWYGSVPYVWHQHARGYGADESCRCATMPEV